MLSKHAKTVEEMRLRNQVIKEESAEIEDPRGGLPYNPDLYEP